ncbi:hypothetical protein PFISCL1PPCAC_17152, partial [Pristionchus fissidentatus]
SGRVDSISIPYTAGIHSSSCQECLRLLTHYSQPAERAIPIGWSLVNINYGPCSHFGPKMCYFFIVILLGGAVYSETKICDQFR